MHSALVSQRKVLLVEDDPSAGRELVFALTKRSWKVERAACKGDALRVASDNRFDAAIVDLGLPDGSGFDVVDVLRGLKAPCASVVLTGGAMPDGGREAARLGVVDYLIKPVRLQVLEVALDRAVAQSNRMRSWARRRGDGPPHSAIAPGEAAPKTNLLSTAVVEFGLTKRQTEALLGVARGLSDKEIQDAMDVSYSRVRQLLTASFRKLGIRGRNQFIKFLAERRAREQGPDAAAQ